MLFVIDPMHSAVEFAVQHLQICVVKGRFSEIHGTIDLDPKRPERSNVKARIQTESIYTGSSKRDAHLRSVDFLDVLKYPVMEFESTEVKLLDQKWSMVSGNLCLRGVTRPVHFQVVYMGTNRDPLSKGWRIGLCAATTIDRREYGMQFNRMSENALLVGNMTRIEMNLEAIQAE